MIRHALWGALCCLMLLSGCTGARKAMEAPRFSPSELHPGDILKTRPLEKVSFDALMEDLSKARVVYAGETHLSIEDHEVQQRILEALCDIHPSPVLALEMIPREMQPVLDRWSAGELDEAAFLKAVKWDRTWGYPFRLYRDLLETARDKELKVLALNAPRQVVRKIARQGLSSLDEGERGRMAREMDMAHASHRKKSRSQFQKHVRGDIKDFEAFYQAQLAWEETMAETLARALDADPSGSPVLVLLGRGHMEYGWGVPRRTESRFPHVWRTVAPLPASVWAEGPDAAMSDYVWLTRGDRFVHPGRGRVGIVLKALEKGEGVEILGVFPGSPAHEAGLMKGDVISRIDDIPVESLDDLHEAMSSPKDPPEYWFHIRREGVMKTLPVTLED